MAYTSNPARSADRWALLLRPSPVIGPMDLLQRIGEQPNTKTQVGATNWDHCFFLRWFDSERRTEFATTRSSAKVPDRGGTPWPLLGRSAKWNPESSLGSRACNPCCCSISPT